MKRLLEDVIDANHRALAGDSSAGLHPGEYQDELPLVALTCVDARLNSLLPQALGVPAEQFIWLRNAGNIITGPLSSTMRSLALACAVKGGKAIAIIGHTDCQVGKMTVMQLVDRFRALGIERQMLPDNLNEYFGIFGSDRQNVIKATEVARSSPLVGPKVPVHGLLVDIESGRLEWLVNGYETLGAPSSRWNELVQSAGPTVNALNPAAEFNLGEMKFPETKIGEVVSAIGSEISQAFHRPPAAPSAPAHLASKTAAPKIPLPSGFSLGTMNFPDVKIGEVVSAIGIQTSPTIPPALPANPPPISGSPPKIPLPPPIRPKAQLHRGRK